MNGREERNRGRKAEEEENWLGRRNEEAEL